MKTHQVKNYSNNIHCTLGWPNIHFSFSFFFYFLNFKIFNSYMRSQTWTPYYCLEEKPEGTIWPTKYFILSGEFYNPIFSSVQLSSSILSNFLQPQGLQHNRSPVPHQLPEFTQTHVHPVSDAIQPSHPLSSPTPPAFNLSQHKGLFKWVGSLHHTAKVLEFQLQHQSFLWVPRTGLL